MESSAPSFYLGLPNLGNTCYIASSLQCFLNLPKIHYFFNSSPYKKTLKTENSSNSLVLLNDLFDEITSNKEFHKEVFKAFIDSFKEFCDGSQQDAQEFLKLLLERIHNLTVSINYWDTYRSTSINIIRIFYRLLKRRYQTNFPQKSSRNSNINRKYPEFLTNIGFSLISKSIGTTVL